MEKKWLLAGVINELSLQVAVRRVVMAGCQFAWSTNARSCLQVLRV